MQQLHYYTLQALVRWLQPRLAEATLTHAFSQDKDELVLRFSTAQKALYIRIGCGQQLQYVVPQTGYRRAAKNTVALFHALRGSVVLGLHQLPHERVLIFSFTDEQRLVLKMHGKRANVLHMQAQQVVALFRTQLTEDLTYQPEALPLALPQTADQLAAMLPSTHTPLEGLRRVYPFLDAVCMRALAQRMAAGQQLWPALQALLHEAQAAPQFFVLGTDFFLFAQPDARAYADVATALQAWLRVALGRHKLHHIRELLQRRAATQLTKAQARLDSVQHSLTARQHQRSPEELGHLLMANLHAIAPNSTEVVVDDLYRGGQLRIALNPKRNAQQNAEDYYAQQRTMLAELQQLQALHAQCTQRVEEANAAQAALLAATDVKSIKQVLAQHPSLQPRANTLTDAQKPYRAFQYMGYAIWVGRDATSNDALTLHHARKNDMWLHAKDVSGSHVVLRQQGKQPFPKPVIEYAAGLAAYYSKLRNHSLAAVSYTPRKYVRKGRGMAPGAVRLEREETILVAPIRPQQAME